MGHVLEPIGRTLVFHVETDKRRTAIIDVGEKEIEKEISGLLVLDQHLLLFFESVNRQCAEADR